MTSDKANRDAYAALVSRQLQPANFAESLSVELRRLADRGADDGKPPASREEGAGGGGPSAAAEAPARLTHDAPIAELRGRLAASEERVREVTARNTALKQDLNLRGVENRTIEASLHRSEFEFTDTAAELAAARAEIERRDLVLGVMRRRLSWRVGAPLRALRRLYTCVREIYRRPDPNPLFDEAFYLEQYPDVREFGMDPYRHYIKFGASESRNPNPMFDSKWYLEQNADVRGKSRNPLIHYYQHGAAEGRDPHPLFSTKWYRAQLSKSEAEGVNPLEHYLRAIKQPSGASSAG